MMKSVNRRDFLRRTAGALTALPIAAHLLGSGSGLAGAGESPPPAAAAAKKHLSDVEVLKRLPQLKSMIGEVAEYDGYVFKSFVRVHVGSAVFSVSERAGADSAVILSAVADGGKFGYNLHADMEAQLDPTTLLARSLVANQTGTERRFKRFLFQKNGVTYLKKKHCQAKGCTDPRHMIKKTTWWGPIPSGDKIVHCPGCKELKHYIWDVIYQHKVDKPFLDMLSSLFVARTCDFALGSSFEVPMVQDRDRWNVTVSAVKEEKVTVKAGTFDCVQVVLDPKNAGDEGGEGRFSGLFGINGSIQIWIDKEKRIPVRILGTIPFAFLDLHCEVCLRKIVTEAPTSA